MNSFDDMIIDRNELNDFASLRQRIDDMTNWIEHLDDEIHSYRRRLWMDYENFSIIANIMEKIIAEFGEDNIKQIVDDYMDKEYRREHMNSFDDMILDKNELNDFGSLRQRIDEMNNWINHLDDEIHSCRRRLWMDYENFSIIANIMERIITEFGEDRIKRIIDDYMQNERQDALRKQRTLARKAELNFDFVDLDSLFSIKL
jgi:DNA gyrase/topoisomerase IV subunit A